MLRPDFEMDVPLMQDMRSDLGEVPGVVIRQVTQLVDAVASTTGLCYERENQFKISALPDGKTAARHHDETGRWRPSGTWPPCE